MYVCMYLCIYVCMYVYIYMYVCAPESPSLITPPGRHVLNM